MSAQRSISTTSTTSSRLMRRKSPAIFKKIANKYSHKFDEDEDEDGLKLDFENEEEKDNLSLNGSTGSSEAAGATSSDLSPGLELPPSPIADDPHCKNSYQSSSVYKVKKTFDDLSDVGQVKVQLLRAKGLYGADFGGKSDPFAVIQLRDVEFKSNTIKKEINPVWDEEFVFPITDMSDIMYITVYDEDRFNDPEFLGKVAIPLYFISQQSPTREVTLALKDKKLQSRAKGHHPQITIKFEIQWNKLRAAIRTIRTQEPPAQQSFKKNLLVNNVRRVRRILHFLSALNKYKQSCFDWEKPPRTIKAFIIFELLVYFFQPFMIPLIFLFFIFIYPLYASDIIIDWLDPYDDIDDDDDDDDKSNSSDKKTISEKYKAIQEVTIYVQNGLGSMASKAERMKNVLTYANPFMTHLAILALITGTIVLYLIPLRVVVMLWGVNKFSKKLIRPNHIPSSELFNFLSRVPDDPTVAKCKPLSIYDQQLLKEEEEEKAKKEKSNSTRIARKVTAFFSKAE